MKYRLGIDMGGTGIKAGVVDESFAIVERASAPTEPGFENVVCSVSRLVRELSARSGIAVSDFLSVGVGTPGFIHPRTGHLVFSANLHCRNVPLGQELERALGTAVRVGNDANCAVVAETVAGRGKGLDNVVMLTLGTGVGGGVIADGKLLCGGSGMGAELGHTPLVAGGEKCTCGIAGCLEAYASGTALIRQTRVAMEAHPESSMHQWAASRGRVSARTAFECARAGDKTALEVVDAFETYLAQGIGGFVNIFRPDMVLIGGGLSNEGDYLLDPVRKKLPAAVFASAVIGVPPVERALLGNDAGIIGAACLNMI